MLYGFKRLLLQTYLGVLKKSEERGGEGRKVRGKVNKGLGVRLGQGFIRKSFVGARFARFPFAFGFAGGGGGVIS